MDEKVSKNYKMKRHEFILVVLAMGEVALLVISNVVGSIVWGFEIPLGNGAVVQIVQDGGILAFPCIYIILDLLIELYGKKTADRITDLAIIMNILICVVITLASRLPVVYGTNSETIQSVLSLPARIIIASSISFWISQRVNSYVFDLIRRHTKPEAYYLRSLGSSWAERIVDTIIFNIGAFWGRSNTHVLTGQIFWALIIPTVIEIWLSPLAKAIASRLGDDES